MSTLHLTRGLPGSGKSTYAKKWVLEDSEGRARVNRDDLRASLFASDSKLLTPIQEQHVTTVEKATVRALLQRGIDVIVDATNLNPRFVGAWMHMGYPVRFHDFPVTIDEALRRNAERENPIPEQAIRRMHRQFTNGGDLLPAPVAPKPIFAPYEQDWEKRSAIIVDIDGTLAHNASGRSFYDMTRVAEDTVIDNVRSVVLAAADTHILILMSGRDESARQDTEDWLTNNRITYDRLLMRAGGDQRRDDVVKAELFDRHVRDTYNVVGVVDDRPQVCRMWRGIGLTTFQVGDPAREF